MLFLNSTPISQLAALFLYPSPFFHSQAPQKRHLQSLATILYIPISSQSLATFFISKLFTLPWRNSSKTFPNPMVLSVLTLIELSTVFLLWTTSILKLLSSLFPDTISLTTPLSLYWYLLFKCRCYYSTVFS